MNDRLMAHRYAKRRGLRLILAVWVAVVLLAGMPYPAAQQSSPPVDFYQVLNRARLNEGLAPLGLSTLLTQAAQRHADDIARRGAASHEGADGSDYRQRIREAGYRAWNDGLLVNEVVWLGLGGPVDALNWFRNRAEEWAIFTDTRYREVGVGYAEDGQGVRYFVIVFGARPGVLPIFINDGAEVTDSPVVAVRLTNEEAEPMGEGAWIGRAIEVQVSDTPDFNGVPWQPWEPLLPWALPGTEPGEYAVYVQFRDGANRTAVAEATIRLVEPGAAPPTPTLLPGLTGGEALPAPETPSPETEGTPQPSPEVGTASPSPPMGTPIPTPAPTFLEPLPTWTPLVDLEPPAAEAKPANWPVIAGFILQGVALFLGAAAFLRRR
ncbi:MAG: CAP domain-containing protein [Anaerolineae bacterium]